MKVSYYRYADGFIAVTGKSPKDFKGVLFVGKGGPLTQIEELVFSPEQLCKLTQVAKDDVPAEWILALGYERPSMPKPEPKPPVEPLFDPETGDLLDIGDVPELPLFAAPTHPRAAVTGLIIGILIGFLCLILGLI